MICSVVLAAGHSRRMGTQKLLLPLAGQAVIARVVDEVLRSPVQQTFVVVQAEAEGIRQALSGRPVHFIVNPDPAGDMLSSVRCGLRALPTECDTVVVILGDQPGLTTDLLHRLLAAHRESGRGIAFPVYGGKGGHPLLFAARFCAEVLHDFDRVGLRGLIEAHPDEVFELEIGSTWALEDMDVPADYERMRTVFGRDGDCGL